VRDVFSSFSMTTTKIVRYSSYRQDRVNQGGRLYCILGAGHIECYSSDLLVHDLFIATVL
jgi:hypothetical protein